MKRLKAVFCVVGNECVCQGQDELKHISHNITSNINCVQNRNISSACK